LSKTTKTTPKVPRKPHPKRYTDPVEDVDKFIEEELDEDKFLIELLESEKAES
jgi:hypothetical protein